MPNINLIQPINWQSDLNRNRDAWWLSLPNQVGGNTFRDLTNRYSGTFLGDTSWVGPKDRHGGHAALILDGSDAIDIGSNDQLTYNRGFTLSAWVHPTASATQGIISAGGLEWYMRLEATTNIVSLLKSQAAYIGGSSTGCPLNKWTQVAITISEGATANVSFYINGKQDATTTTTQTFTGGSQKVYIGRDTTSSGPPGTAGEHFTGLLDDISIHSRELSVADIELLYEDSKSGYKETLNFTRRNYYTQLAQVLLANRFPKITNNIFESPVISGI